MNPSAGHTLLQLLQTSIVYWAEVRTVGWSRVGAMKSGVSQLNSCMALHALWTAALYCQHITSRLVMHYLT